MPAARFHDGKHGATFIVRVLPFGRELRIVGEGDATIAAWRTDQVRAAPERDPDGVVTLTARDHPGVLLIDDPAELETLHRAGIKLPGYKAWTRGHWLGVGAGVLATLALAILALNAVPRWIAAAMPVAWERHLGTAAEALIAARGGRCGGTEGQAALEHLVERLRAAGDIEMPVTISVLDDPTINAFTLPGGHVLVMRGLFSEAADGPMLAGVLAHELGHVAHRDPTTLLLRGMGFSILLSMIGSGDAGVTAAGGVTNLMNLAYTRSAEAAADDFAIEVQTRAGLRADGLSRFFARMERRESGPDSDAGKQQEPKPDDQSGRDKDERHDGGGGTTMSWFATHPSSASRRERTARPETGQTPFTEAEWQAIRTMCTGKSNDPVP